MTGRSSGGAGDHRGLRSWNAEEKRLGDKKRLVMLTPDPSRHKEDGTNAEIIGSASSPGEHGVGMARTTARKSAPPRRTGPLARPRSLILQAWKELIRGDPDAISKAVYMRMYSQIARRVALEPGGPGAKPSADKTKPPYDLSMAENSWAASSKGHASINFEQFKAAWRAMARGFEATPTDSARYDAFCSAAMDACRTIGKEQRVKRRIKRKPSKTGSKLLNLSGPHHRGLSLQGSSPTSERKVTPSDEGVAMLLTPARQTAYGFVDDTGTRTERSLADRGGSRSEDGHLKRDVVAPGSPRGKGRSGTFVAQGPPQGISDSRVWPPAWVKLKDDRHRTGARREDRAPVFARGIFTAPPPSFGGQTDVRTPRVNGLPPKRSSASQEALSLQQKLRHHRVRRREIQRHPGHLLTVSSSIADVDSAAALTDAKAAELLPREQLLDLHSSSGIGVGGGYEKLHGQRDAALTCIAIGRTTGSQGSPELSTSSQGASMRDEVALSLPCRLCRRSESAMWCSECKAAFCIPCFESLSHHLGSGVLSTRDRDVPEPRRRCGTIDTNFSSTLVEGSIVPPGFKSVSVPDADSKEFGGHNVRGESDRIAQESEEYEPPGTRIGIGQGKLVKPGATETTAKRPKHKLAVLPQNEFETSRFIPAMCFNSGTGGLCSARDLGNIKYDHDSTKVIIPTTQLQLDVSQGNYHGCDSFHKRSDQLAAGCGVKGVSRDVKTFGRIPVHIVTATQ